ncbi:MAG: glucose-6-phosphate dehydrogenase [Planctomycetaceae bacterium]|nr:glucose-6-phosphate dehydrogenase [Planctomycetaceae bacterium]
MTEARQTLVLFGASGDLTHRKILPALYRLYQAGRLPASFRLFGYARSDLDDESFRRMADLAMAEYAEGYTESCPDFLDRMFYVRGDYDGGDGFDRLRERIQCDSCEAPNYYLALPPQAASKVVDAFASGRLPTDGARVLMEKPFGTDLASARHLNRQLQKYIKEEHIHRIDHYLAKDTVRNLLVFRFANVLFEPLWNRHYVDHIQVSATETIGVENRGGYYDGIGVVRDMLQNHVLLLLAFAAMEPPLANDSESIRDRTAEFLRSIDPPARRDFVFGQYEGYRDAPGVNPQSQTPTFAAVRLSIHNWRWHGVPVYLMSGKCLDERVSEVTFVFKDIPLHLLEDNNYTQMDPNVLSLRIHPSEGIRLSLGVKAPGYRDRVVPAALDFRYADLTSGLPSADRELFSGYERVLMEALAGRPGLAWRADAIESAWRVVAPILDEEDLTTNISLYVPGSAGADLAAGLLARDNRVWHRSEFE